jgi:acetylserotonin N-methyltransferase
VILLPTAALLVSSHPDVLGARSGGALLICEMLLDEGGTSPPEVLLQALNMLTQTHGRERKASEYCHLLETTGFTDITSKRTGTYLDVVMAYKRQECAQ